MNDTVSMRKEAIDYATQAFAADNNGKDEEAIKLYIKSAEKLQQLIKIDDNKFNKETYMKKAKEYAVRAAELKNKLGPSDGGGSGCGGGSGGGSGGESGGGDESKLTKSNIEGSKKE